MREYNGDRVMGVRGFSLIEVIIAIAVLMTTSLGFMALMTQMNRNVLSLEQRSDVESTFNLIKMYLLQNKACTNTFSKDGILIPTAGHNYEVITANGAKFLAIGQSIDIAKRVTFEGIQLPSADKDKKADQELQAVISFKVVSKNGTRQDTRSFPVSFVYDTTTSQYSCRTAQTDAFDGSVEAACQAIGGKYDSATKKCAQSTNGTSIADALGCLQKCISTRAPIVNEDLTASTTYGSASCTCQGAKPCTCNEPWIHLKGAPYQDSCGREGYCVGTHDHCPYVPAVNETEVGKAIVYKNDIGETQLCIGTNVPPKCECEQSKVDGTAFGTKFPDTCGAADKCTGTKHTAVYKYVTRNATDEESTFAEWGKGLWNYVSVPGWFGIFAGTKNCFVRCEYKVFSAETGTAMNNGNSEFRYGGKFSIKSGKSCDHEAHDYLACAGDWSHRLNNKTKEFYTRDGANLYNGPVPAGMKKAINENYTVRREECGNPWDNTYGWTTWSREHAEDDIPYFCGSPLNEEAMFVELKF